MAKMLISGLKGQNSTGLQLTESSIG